MAPYATQTRIAGNSKKMSASKKPEKRTARVKIRDLNAKRNPRGGTIVPIINAPPSLGLGNDYGIGSSGGGGGGTPTVNPLNIGKQTNPTSPSLFGHCT
jgi:hypothetical protein